MISLRKSLCGFCAFLVGIFVFTGCTPQRPLPELALTPSSPFPLALERDRSFTAEFLQALDRQIALYDRSPAQAWRVGNRIITTTDLRETLYTLRTLLHPDLPPKVVEEILYRHFDWYQVTGDDSRGIVLVTGYYAPVLKVRRQPDEQFRYPIYKRPSNLQVRLIRENGRERKEVGRIEGDKWWPYFTREEIEGAGVLRGNGLEIAYSDDPLAVYMLQVQGSGYLQFPNEPLCLVNYAADNGYPYTSLGKIFIEEGKMTPQEISLQRIRHYFQERPDDLLPYLWRNKRYIFFQEVCPATLPTGSVGLPLTPGYSIATDLRLFPPGGLALLLTTQPVADALGNLQAYKPLQRLVLNQDSGAAIQGPGRVDFFWGNGESAEFSAGHMKQRGVMFFLFRKRGGQF